MARWKIERERSVGVTPGTDGDAAFTFHLTGGAAEHQITVEYAQPSRLASLSHARGIVRDFLDDETPPRRVVVGRDGQVVRTGAE